MLCATKGFSHFFAQRRNGLILFRTDNLNALATNLDLNVLDQAETDILYPLLVRGKCGQLGLQVHTVNQIAVAGDLARHAAAEAGGAVENVLDGLAGPVGVAAVHDLEDIRV